MAKTPESALANAVIAILKDRPHGQATFAELFKVIPDHVDLTEEDWKESTVRPGEPMWHQRTRNITSHNGEPGNAITQGRLVSIPDGLALPPKIKAA